MSLTAKTVGLSVLASAAGIVLLAGLATVTATDHVRDQVAETMEAAMAPRIEALNALGAAIEADLASVAETALVSEGLTRMSAAFAETVAADGSATALRSAYVDNNPFPTGEKHRLDQAAEAGAYNWAHGDVHPAMRILIEARNYYDIFLIDNTGALVYSVFKEADFGTNVLNGPYRDSGLGRLTRTLLTGAPGEVVMEDFSPYAPSAGTPQAFAGRAITDAAGQRIGIVAFQIPKTQVEAAIRIGDEGGVILPFLVGADGLLRSDLTSTEANDIGKTAFDVSAPVPFGGHPRLREGVGVAGSPVLLETAAIDFLGMDWTLVASRDRDLALKHEYALKEQLLIMSLPALLIPALAALLIGRTTTRPIRRLAEVAGALARGEQAELPDRERQDEIGALARSMEPINEAAVSARRLNSALDAASSAMAVADAEFRIVYVNAALISIVRKTESYWQKKRPEFSADKLIGQSIDFFHNVPDRNRNMLSGMQSPHNARIKFGDFVADLAIAPVSDASGNRIGYVLQWDDCTALANAEEQLS
ncbi:MAG: HAMP domain-containing protein, partial [Pseudomonadota bacterium]